MKATSTAPKSALIAEAGDLKIELAAADGAVTVLKDKTPVKAGEIIDAAVMSVAKLKSFLQAQVDDARAKGVLFSVHLKATMMKVSDPSSSATWCPCSTRTCWPSTPTRSSRRASTNNGIGDLYAKIQSLPAEQQAAITADIDAAYKTLPALAMVNSDRGITNLHVPSDVIVDASMPAMIRDSGKMWNAAGELQDAKAVIPDRCYAGVYQP